MSAAFRISLIYLLLASAWIWLSDSFAYLLPIPDRWAAHVQSIKGGLFVVLTAALLYWLIRTEERRQHDLQAELRQTRVKLEHLVDASTSVIYAFEQKTAAPRLSLSYVSANIERLTGYAPDYLYQHQSIYWERLHPDDQEMVRVRLKRSMQEGAGFTLQYRWRHLDGAYRWIEDRSSISRNPDSGLIELIGNWRDITQLKQDQLLLQITEERWRFAIDGSNLGLWDWDVTAGTVFFSTRWKAMLGFEEHEIGDQISEWSDRVHPDDLPAVQGAFQAMLADPDAYFRSEHRIRCKNGDYIWILDQGKVVERDERGGALRVIGTHTDLTELKRRMAAEETIQHLTQHDTLTNLPNQSVMRDRLGRALAQATRNDEALSVMFMDLDRFKNINDSLGPTAGDALLVAVAERLTESLRQQDTVSRQGGDEFTLLLPGVDAEGAAHVAQKLLAGFAEPFPVAGQLLVVAPSIGIAMYPNDGQEVDALLQASDLAMYRAKREGGSTFRFHTADMHQRVSKTLYLENELRKALRREELLLHFQPQVSLTTGRVVGCEALVRWQHPEMGLMPPAEFIPVAEDCGLIVPIGDWVLRTATRQCRAWQQAGLTDLVVAVNVSTVQFRQADFAQSVQQALVAADLNPRYLEVEITESVMADDPERAIHTMLQLHELGVQLSIDDFGTGYSSFSYLKRFRIHKLKIDQSFVRDLNTDSNSASIAEAIISMAHSLGLSVIAEGVETEAHARWLAEHRCDDAQGYLFARPMPADQFVAWLASPAASEAAIKAST